MGLGELTDSQDEELFQQSVYFGSMQAGILYCTTRLGVPKLLIEYCGLKKVIQVQTH